MLKLLKRTVLKRCKKRKRIIKAKTSPDCNEDEVNGSSLHTHIYETIFACVIYYLWNSKVFFGSHRNGPFMYHLFYMIYNTMFNTKNFQNGWMNWYGHCVYVDSNFVLNSQPWDRVITIKIKNSQYNLLSTKIHEIHTPLDISMQIHVVKIKY